MFYFILCKTYFDLYFFLFFIKIITLLTFQTTSFLYKTVVIKRLKVIFVYIILKLFLTPQCHKKLLTSGKIFSLADICVLFRNEFCSYKLQTVNFFVLHLLYFLIMLLEYLDFNKMAHQTFFSYSTKCIVIKKTRI